MHVVIVHGYFLKGTGSNLFVKNICCELCRMGHQVSLFCQEKDISEIDFIEKAYDFDPENKACFLFHHKETAYPGKCTLFRPNINGFLPVFVYDRYHDYSVKEYTSCTEEELERYLADNQNALNHGLQGASPDIIWSNHTIMQPVYVSRSNFEKKDALHIMTVHGSCLNFAVRKSPLLTKYAWEAIENADKITFVSAYSKKEFLDYFQNRKSIKEKAVVIPAGVDLDKFLPLPEKVPKSEWIQKMLSIIAGDQRKTLANDTTSSWQTDHDIIEKINKINFDREKIVLYYGKYLWTKGPQLLIAAIPIVLQKFPDTRFIFVGYGSSRTYFEALLNALDHGNQEEYLLLIENAKGADNGMEPAALRFFSTLAKRLRDPDFAERYFNAARNRIRSMVIFTGFLPHETLKYFVACADISVAPSIFPEAFGLVAVEALSAGIIPVQTNHSGFKEVIQKYVDEFTDVFDHTKLPPLYLDKDLVLNLANNLIVLLTYYGEISHEERQMIRKRARHISEQNYSWRSIVTQYLLLHRSGEVK